MTLETEDLGKINWNNYIVGVCIYAEYIYVDTIVNI
jgi:5-formaminoimidazole-4-carboxamide-1-beta-D-ribofuranosyl 5'-monophosphate synthetase